LYLATFCDAQNIPLLAQCRGIFFRSADGDFGNVAMIRQERDRITWMDGLEIQLE
jgi:hypothetical protein